VVVVVLAQVAVVRPSTASLAVRVSWFSSILSITASRLVLG